MNVSLSSFQMLLYLHLKLLKCSKAPVLDPHLFIIYSLSLFNLIQSLVFKYCLARKFIQVFQNMQWKDLNELFGQLNIT